MQKIREAIAPQKNKSTNDHLSIPTNSDRPSRKSTNQRSPIHTTNSDRPSKKINQPAIAYPFPTTSDRLYKKINQPAIAYPSHKQRSPL